MSNQYRLVPIQATSRPLVGLNRQPLQNMDLSTVGSAATGILLHWMDPEQYAGQVQYARAMLTAAIRNRAPVQMQIAAKSIVAAYNDLNIPWEIDPRARFLYQTFVAGSPSGGTRSEFSSGVRYNNTVFLAPDPLRCIVVPGLASGSTFGGCNSDNGNRLPDAAPGLQAFTGAFPGLAASRYTSWVPAGAGITPIQYVPRLQFVLRVPDEASKLDSQYWVSSDPHVPLPFDPGLLTAETVFNDVLWRSKPYGNYRHADGSDALGDPDGWDVSAFDTGGATTPMQVRLSYADYATYLSAWISALEERSAAEVVQDARAYAIYRNSQTAGPSGGLQSLAAGMIANIDVLNTPSAQVGNDLHLVGAAALATGATLAPVTFGVSALIGGAVSALTALGALVVPSDLSRVYIDDLERPKPWIERSWLGGSPSIERADGGAPAIYNIPDPPGWTRPAAPHAQPLTPALLAQLRTAGLQTPAPPFVGDIVPLLASVPAPVWIGAGLVIGAAALYAGSRLTQGRASSGRRTSTRRRSRSRS